MSGLQHRLNFAVTDCFFGASSWARSWLCVMRHDKRRLLNPRQAERGGRGGRGGRDWRHTHTHTRDPTNVPRTAHARRGGGGMAEAFSDLSSPNLGVMVLKVCFDILVPFPSP